MPTESDVLQKWAVEKPLKAAATQRRLLHLGVEAKVLKLPGQPLPDLRGMEAKALKSPRHEAEAQITNKDCASPIEMQAQVQKLRTIGATLTLDGSYDCSALVRKALHAFPCGNSTCVGGMPQNRK